MFEDLPFEPSHRAPTGERSGWLFGVHGGRVLVTTGEAPAFPPVTALGAVEPGVWHYLGRLRAAHCWAVRFDADAPPAGFEFRGLRSLFSQVPDDLLAVAGRALQIVEWDDTHRYCGRCGTAMRARVEERAKECPSCAHVAYPRVAPAMMVLVRRGAQLLLARAPRFPGAMYSALAGFVEPGESIEECIRREVREEVGVEVEGMRYFASQPWPFPHSLMIAFTAKYAGGELRPDPAEIADAQWFDLDRLPQLPVRISIARRLIDATVAEMRAAREAG
jgi:NAD+ diphosphatase